MKNSRVLIVGLSNCTTEMARHLVLSGINIELVQLNQETVTDQDYLNDFLYEPSDEGKLKVEVVCEKLSQMNPFAKITATKIAEEDVVG